MCAKQNVWHDLQKLAFVVKHNAYYRCAAEQAQ